MIKFKDCKPLISGREEIELESNGKVWDLHNAAEFVEIKYKVTNQQLSLVWDYYDYETSKISYNLEIFLLQVSRFEITPRDSEMPIDEDTCLEKLVYSADTNSISFIFSGGIHIVAVCMEIEFKIRDV